MNAADQRSVVPADREAILAEAGTWGRDVFKLVRGIVDDLDAAAPWSHLYYAPDEADAFFSMQGALIWVVEEIPQRVRATLDNMAGNDSRSPMSLKEIAAYFDGILSLIRRDLQLLKNRLEGRGKNGLKIGDREFICELAADLKGKCCSALMGVAARVVAQGRWPGIDIEPILFPEKAEEFRRSERLQDALGSIVALIRRLPEEVPFHSLIERWLSCRRVDLYALADLLGLLGTLGQLLKERYRRALYSGDYHRIRERERSLNVRVSELLTLHRLTWSGSLGEEQTTVYSRLVQLTLEVVTIIDADLLRGLIGEARFAHLRNVASASVGVHNGRVDPASTTVADYLTPLVKLLGDDDLRTFLEMLHGNVLKRASLSGRQDGDAFQPAAAAEGRVQQLERPTEEEHRPPPVTEPVAEPTPPIPLRPGPPVAPPPPDLSEHAEAVERVQLTLTRLVGSQNPRWRSFVETVVADSGSRMEPETVRLAQEFGWELADHLVPQLARVAPLRDLEEQLSVHCAKLIATPIDPQGLDAEIHDHLNKIYRLLEGLPQELQAVMAAK